MADRIHTPDALPPEGRSWKAFGDRLGWNLVGWTYDRTATFQVSGTSDWLYVNNVHRASIEAAMEKHGG